MSARRYQPARWSGPWRGAVAAVIVAMAVLASAASGAERAPTRPSTWVGSWAAAVTPTDHRPQPQQFADTTLRQTVHMSVGGEALRLRVTNVYGDGPLTIGAMTVAIREGASGTPTVDPDAVVPVRFDDAQSIRVPPGAEWISDPVAMTVPDDADLVISMYLPDPTPSASVHYEAVARTFAAQGDATTDPGSAYSQISTSRYFLDGVDVRAQSSGSVVAFGDSITDGVQSELDANHRYPDALADRLLELPEPREMGVLNAGLSANRLLTDAGLGGESALARFERDVLGQTGVRTVVLLEGINDIHNSYGEVEARELIAAYEQFVTRAHEAGVRILGGTILPFEGAPRYTLAGEADRQELNHWIRTSGVFDGVVDFDAALRDPTHPTRLDPKYDTGDHVHPNDAGLAAMAEAVDLSLLTR